MARALVGEDVYSVIKRAVLLIVVQDLDDGTGGIVACRIVELGQGNRGCFVLATNVQQDDYDLARRGAPPGTVTAHEGQAARWEKATAAVVRFQVLFAGDDRVVTAVSLHLNQALRADLNSRRAG